MSDKFTSHSLTVKDVEIKILEESIPHEMDVNLLDKTYVIGLVNMTANTCFTIAATKPAGSSESQWKWTVIPKTCPNCRSDYNTCSTDGRYSAIMSTECDSPPFDLFVGYMVDNDTAKGAQFTIIPNCQYSGGLIGID